LCVPADAQPVYLFYDAKIPQRFELIAVDSEFFISTDVKDLATRQPHWKSLVCQEPQPLPCREGVRGVAEPG
jgi:hypothetical protein